MLEKRTMMSRAEMEAMGSFFHELISPIYAVAGIMSPLMILFSRKPRGSTGN